MKTKLVAALCCVALAAIPARAVGLVNFANSSTTTISVGNSSQLMPGSGLETFYFALFVAPSSTVTGSGQSIAFDNITFQLPVAYATNSTVAGRIQSRNALDVGSISGFSEGQTVDFVVRGWSANFGTTWPQALENWQQYGGFNYGWIGSSTVGDNLVLGGGPYPSTTLFGAGPSQVPGFTMIGVPEPSAGVMLMGAMVVVAANRRRFNVG